MNVINLSDKQIPIFVNIVEYYIETSEAIGSKVMMKHFDLDISSATIRNIMSELEQLQLIEKNHHSSGRIPTKLGLEFYAKNYAFYDNHDLKIKLKKIFLQRSLSIDEVIDIAAKTISDVIGVTLITSGNEDEVLKSLQLISLSKTEATILIVSSKGNVRSKNIDFSNAAFKIQDLKIVIKFFHERLKNTQLHELENKVLTLVPLLSNMIHNHEEIVQLFVQQVFKFQTQNRNQIYGKNSLILSRDIKREDLIQLMDLIENQSIWSQLNPDDEEENIKIDIRPDNSSFLSKRIQIEKNKIKEFTFVGDSKMDIRKTKSALLLIEELLNSLNTKKLENKKEK